MNWKTQFEEYEKSFGVHAEIDWKPAIALAQKVIENGSDDVEAYIRVIYLLHNIVVEEDYPESEHDHMAELLKQYFNESCKRFSENAEYLFFIGKILHIAEWYFGLEDSKLAVEFQKKAMEKEPGNLLYEWAYRFSCLGDVVEGYLAHQLITDEKDKVRWLKSKGFPGEYILEHLETSNQEYLENKASQ
ncbi:MAG: hypothetical protein V4615_02475 [Bacteroidota bacterium]